MLSTKIGVNDIVIQKINYDEWKAFDQSLRSSTKDTFMIDLSDRLSDVFCVFDEKENDVIVDNSPLLDGIFIEGKLVGLLDYGETTFKERKATNISFLLIHPNEQRKGIGKAVVEKIIQESKYDLISAYPCTYSSKVLFSKLGFTFADDLLSNRLSDYDIRFYFK